jgi:hypothetical protein
MVNPDPNHLFDERRDEKTIDDFLGGEDLPCDESNVY